MIKKIAIILTASLLIVTTAKAAPPTPQNQVLRSESGNVDIETGSTGSINFATNGTRRLSIDGTTGALVAAALDAAATYTTLTQSAAGTLSVLSSGLFSNAGKSFLGTSLTTFTNVDSIFAPARVYVMHDVTTNIGVGIIGRAASANGANMSFYKTRSANDGEASTIVNASDQIANIGFYGSSGTGYAPAAKILVTVDGTPGATTDMPGAIDFQLSPDGSATPASALKLNNQALATFAGSLQINTAGQGILIRGAGAAAQAGTFVCNGVTGVVVSTTNASTSMALAFSPATLAGTAPIGSPYVSAVSAGTSFTVKCSVAGETSTYNWAMVKIN